MAYEKTLWVKDVTIISAALLNKIENQLGLLDNSVSGLKLSQSQTTEKILAETQERISAVADLGDKINKETIARVNGDKENAQEIKSVRTKTETLQFENDKRIEEIVSVDDRLSTLVSKVDNHISDFEESLVTIGEQAATIAKNENKIETTSKDLEVFSNSALTKSSSYGELLTTDKTVIGAINELQKFSASQLEVDEIQERIVEIFDILANFPVPLK